MAFFSKTLDKLKGALRKTAAVLNTDVRTLFVPGRQINDEFLNEIGKLLQAASHMAMLIESGNASLRQAAEQQAPDLMLVDAACGDLDARKMSVAGG